MRDFISKLFAVPLFLALLAITACSGGTVVTLTATPSSDPFVAYRVGVASIQLTTSSGKPSVMILPAETSVDFTKVTDLSEVLGAPTVPKGTYSGAEITLDYSTAQIIYDDGSLDGVALAPVDSSGKALGLARVKVSVDPADPLRSAAKQASRLSLSFNLAASNLINLSNATVTITPLISASMQPIDTKQVRLNGPLMSANSSVLTTGVMPFDSTTAAPGNLSIEPSDTTTYEINGFVSTGAPGQTQIAALPANTVMTVFGTLTASSSATIIPQTTTPADTTPTDTTPTDTTPTDTTVVTTPTTSTTSTVTFTASQVLVDGTVQGVGLARLSGVVAARSGNTLGIEEATLTQNGSTETLVPGTTIVNVGPSTLVTFFGQGVEDAISTQQISVGSVIEVFGTASNTSTGQVLVDASAGRVRLDLTSALGLVTAQGSNSLTLSLTAIGGRAISAFDFTGSGASPTQYGVVFNSSSPPDLSNSTVGAPVIATGFANAFATAAPNFTASTLLDPTTINAQLVIDWSGGTAAPFSSFDSTSIVLDPATSNFGSRHQIQIGSQLINLVGLASNPSITPATSSSVVFSIGHASSSTVENFETYTAFITQLQTELNGTTLATGMTAIGQYTASTFAFAANSITIFLNN
ncbi:MAG TPA: hypothetical protein VK743_11710 [Steroidobacteraceae bacterium]|jgi:hypothetical protein|nr:hypothetical protein [Steroidobacteraceae bacterium]